MKHFEDIKDDEIRIISRKEVIRKPLYRRWWFWTAMVAAVVLLAVALVLALRPKTTTPVEVTEPLAESVPVAPTIVKSEPATVIVRDTVVNDVPLRIHTPVNAMPELLVGIPDTNDKSVVLCLQAADIRADNHEIVGAFVLKGELLSRGVAKKGFCAIIDGKIQLGMAESTPLFEEATSKDGYFFLTVHGDAGETVSLRLYDEDHDTYYNIEGTIGLKPLVGSMKEPFLLHQAGHETSVVDIRESIQKDDYYTLEGIQLRQTPRKGVYIHNGRKVVIR